MSEIDLLPSTPIHYVYTDLGRPQRGSPTLSPVVAVSLACVCVRTIQYILRRLLCIYLMYYPLYIKHIYTTPYILHIYVYTLYIYPLYIYSLYYLPYYPL